VETTEGRPAERGKERRMREMTMEICLTDACKVVEGVCVQCSAVQADRRDTCEGVKKSSTQPSLELLDYGSLIITRQYHRPFAFSHALNHIQPPILPVDPFSFRRPYPPVSGYFSIRKVNFVHYIDSLNVPRLIICQLSI
jgi:hypothetical protein